MVSITGIPDDRIEDAIRSLSGSFVIACSDPQDQSVKNNWVYYFDGTRDVEEVTNKVYDEVSSKADKPINKEN
ncbi:hypothetical protein IWW36_002860, partial [Coemansia brasiliensis]